MSPPTHGFSSRNYSDCQVSAVAQGPLKDATRLQRHQDAKKHEGVKSTRHRPIFRILPGPLRERTAERLWHCTRPWLISKRHGIAIQPSLPRFRRGNHGMTARSRERLRVCLASYRNTASRRMSGRCAGGPIPTRSSRTLRTSCSSGPLPPLWPRCENK